MNRRGFLAGLLFAPAIIRTSGLLMPIKPPVISNLFGFMAGQLVELSWTEISGDLVTSGTIMYRIGSDGLARRVPPEWFLVSE